MGDGCAGEGLLVDAMLRVVFTECHSVAFWLYGCWRGLLGLYLASAD